MTAARQRFLAIFPAGSQQTLVIDDGIGPKQANVELTAEPKVGFWADATGFDWQLQLTAVDPVYYDTTVQSGSTTLPTPGAVGLDWSTGGGLNWGMPNYAPNPNFETSTVGWGPRNSSTLARQAGGSVGGFSCLVTSTQASTETGLITTPSIKGLVSGAGYTFSADVKPSTTSTMTMYADWLDATGTFISTTSVATSGVTSGTWQSITSTHTAPANADRANLYVTGGVMAVGASFGIDNLMFRPTAATGTGTGLDWGSSISNGTLSLGNTGNADAWPVFTFVGPLTMPMVTNNATGQALAYSGTLAAGDSVVVTTSPFGRSVLLSGADRFTLMTSASWFPIPPGSTVTVAFAASAGSGSLSASWRSASW
jgi:hypothetical protein